MKKLNRVVLVIFSVIILIIGIFVNLLAVNWIDFNTVFRLIRTGLTDEPASQIILILNEIFMLFAIICIFADPSDKKRQKAERDVLLQNDNGKLMISRTTIENLVNTVIRNFSGVTECVTKIQLDNENNVIVTVNLTVTKDVVIKELTLNLQNRIKETIKKTSDLEVKEVNVRIKNIVGQEENDVKN